MCCPKLVVFARDGNISHGKCNLKDFSKHLCSEYLHGYKGARVPSIVHFLAGKQAIAVGILNLEQNCVKI